MSDERIDFSTLETPRSDELVRAVNARCASLLAARRAHGTLVQIAAWRWPIVAAAVAIALASTAVFSVERPGPTPLASYPPTGAVNSKTELAQALGVPSVLAASLSRPTPPILPDLLSEFAR